MKNKFLPLFLVLSGYVGYSQVGVGTLKPNKSTQLEVIASDKGVLIPRLPLTGSTDATTIKSGNVNSLLVFNTAAVSDIQPGYYYWYIDKWHRIAVSDEAAKCCGATGGDGAPGDKGEPGYPGEGILIYTDNSSSDVYVQNPDGTWTKINGKNGKDGKDGKDGAVGVAGGNGAPGNKGEDGYPGENINIYTDKETNTVYIQNSDGTFTAINGRDGTNGTNGVDGKNFKYEDFTLEQLDGLRGPQGNDGVDGKNFKYEDFTLEQLDGLRGPKGNDGTNGVDGKSFKYEDFTKEQLEGLRGPKGNDGINGIDGLGGKTVEGTNVTVKGKGTEEEPYVVSSPIETASQTPSNSIDAMPNVTVAVPSKNVQGAIEDLAKEVVKKWDVRGNAGTTARTNFIGTTDDMDLVFKRNNILSGRIGTLGGNTSFGENALGSSANGDNTAFGYGALNSNNSGRFNVAVGFNALSQLTTGIQNVAIGYYALKNITSEDFCTAVGDQALSRISGDNNVGIGHLSGGGTYYTSKQSIFIGSFTRPKGDDQINQIVIGFNAIGRGSNTVQIGDGSMRSIGGAVEWSIGSDLRLKKDIVTSNYGLNFINKLRPVTYKMKTGPTELQSGFIAQEVEAAANSIGYEFNGIVKPQSDTDFYSLRYAGFVVPLVKAVQEQQTEIETLKKEVENLKEIVQKLIDKQ
jgi:hypothetical protein